MTKHYYAFGVLVSWVTNILLIAFWYDGQSAISYVANESIWSYLLLQLCSVVFVLSVLRFLRGYLFDHIGADKLFKQTYYVALAMVAITNAVPSVADTVLFDVHIALALIAFAASGAVYLQLAMNPRVAKWLRVLIIAAIPAGIYVFITYKSITGQFAIIALGQAVILLTAYIPIQSDIRH